ncbi:MAG: hypothetical protein LQ349_001204 [Xanthoria aureola]|nr:MAG: hypothetical protein LQ349_001204 [Xanthoria aureola]
MRSCCLVGAVFYLIATALALPLFPQAASNPSTSIVERRWDPISLLRRALPPHLADIPVAEPYQNQHLKGAALKFSSDNPVVKSLFTRPSILNRAVDASHQERSALSKRGEETVTTDYNTAPPAPQPGTTTATGIDLKDPYDNQLDMNAKPGAGGKGGRWGFIFNKAVSERIGK